MLLTFKNIGVPIAPNKTEGPCTTLEFMGINLDTVQMEARRPVDKVERIQASLPLFQTKKSCTLKELQSLIGTLDFACKVIPPWETLSAAYDRAHSQGLQTAPSY